MSGMAVCSSKAWAMPASRSSCSRSRVGWRSIFVRFPFRSGEVGVVLRPADMGVLRGEGERVLLVVAGLVQAGREDGLDGPVAQRADVQGAAAGGLQAFGGIGAQEPHESEAAAVALLGVGLAFEEPFDERGRVRSGLAAPGDEPRRCPFRMGAVGGGHVCAVGRVSAFPADPEVRGDPAVLVEDLHGLGRDPNVDLATAQRVGDAVERVRDLDVVVEVDPGLAPLRVLVALGRERLERWPVQILEPAAAAALRSSRTAARSARPAAARWPRGVRRARRTSGCAAAP